MYRKPGPVRWSGYQPWSCSTAAAPPGASRWTSVAGCSGSRHARRISALQLYPCAEAGRSLSGPKSLSHRRQHATRRAPSVPSQQKCRWRPVAWSRIGPESLAAAPNRRRRSSTDRKECSVTTLATQFRSALSNIEPGDDSLNAARAHKQVSDALQSDERLASLESAPSSLAHTRGTCPSAGSRTWMSSSG